MGKVTFSVSQVAEASLQMQGKRVIVLRSNPPFSKERLETVTIFHADNELIVNVAGCVLRKRHPLREPCLPKQLPIPLSICSACIRPSSEVSQLYPKHSSLKGIQSKVPTHDPVIVFRFAPVDPEHPQHIRQLLIVRHHHPTIAEGAEVLAREEGEISQMPHRAGVPPLLVKGPYSLGGVLDDGNHRFSRFE